MLKNTSEIVSWLKKQRKAMGAVVLLFVLSLSGCSGVQFGQLFNPVNIDNFSVYEQARLGCTLQSGLMSETDFAFISSGIVSVGLRLPSSADMDFNYDRRLDDYHDCLRIAGL